MGGKPGVVYLGTHFGLFTSTDGGRTWPQPRGVLNTLMILTIAVSPTNPQVMAIIGRPYSNLDVQGDIYFSTDGGENWQKSSEPSGLPLSAYLFTVQAGTADEGHFYAFYDYAGWFETRDMGRHWRAITSDTVSNWYSDNSGVTWKHRWQFDRSDLIALLVDPLNPQHLYAGSFQPAEVMSSTDREVPGKY